MRLIEVMDVDKAMRSLRDEIHSIRQSVIKLRQSHAKDDVRAAEERLIRARMKAQLLKIPLKQLIPNYAPQKRPIAGLQQKPATQAAASPIARVRPL